MSAVSFRKPTGPNLSLSFSKQHHVKNKPAVATSICPARKKKIGREDKNDAIVNSCPLDPSSIAANILT